MAFHNIFMLLVSKPISYGDFWEKFLIYLAIFKSDDDIVLTEIELLVLSFVF